jgi:hypothetical protein
MSVKSLFAGRTIQTHTHTGLATVMPMVPVPNERDDGLSKSAQMI